MSGASATAAVVYVANADTQDLTVFDLRADGAMALLGTVAVQRPAQVGRSIVLAPSPDRKFLYAGHLSGAGQTAVATFAVNARSGMPERLGSAALADTTAYLATDRSGRFLFSASYSGNQVTVNAIRADGSVGDTLQVVCTEPKAHCIVTDPSNRFVLHTSLGGGLIYQERFDARTGKLSPNDPPTVGARAKSGPRFLVFAPDGKFVYLINELDAAVDVHPFDPRSGTLAAAIQTANTVPERFSGRPWGADIHLRPDGKFLYVSERTTSMITAFAVDPASGRLTRVDAYPTVKQPRAFNIDPSGRYLLSAGQLSNTVVCHLIDAASGELIALREHAVGKNPTWVESVALTQAPRPRFVRP
ncbi:MAG TPA: beta-propeller fold lactonase family protein [Steroidobacteraceae bacterium]|nr:beta-propeller fold lactonase family protein [Steroidobacteraceae bacterium]